MYEEQNCADYEVHLRRGKRSRRLGKFGGGEGIRTPDPLLAKQVLSRLSYTPTYGGLDYSRVALTRARSHGERMDSRVRRNDGLMPNGIATLRSQ